mmetsp:Transcript_34424/g.73458  ORF Transcript_34424/g.73458 Transcript_34424/m.73458 type:complete len:201 (+) Transcript_34424:198-800(+)
MARVPWLQVWCSSRSPAALTTTSWNRSSCSSSIPNRAAHAGCYSTMRCRGRCTILTRCSEPLGRTRSSSVATAAGIRCKCCTRYPRLEGPRRWPRRVSITAGSRRRRSWSKRASSSLRSSSSSTRHLSGFQGSSPRRWTTTSGRPSTLTWAGYFSKAARSTCGRRFARSWSRLHWSPTASSSQSPIRSLRQRRWARQALP